MLRIIFKWIRLFISFIIFASSPASLYPPTRRSCLPHQDVCESKVLQILFCKSRHQQLPGCSLCYVFCTNPSLSLLLFTFFKLCSVWLVKGTVGVLGPEKMLLLPTTHGVISIHASTHADYCYTREQTHINTTFDAVQYLSCFHASKVFLCLYLFIFSFEWKQSTLNTRGPSNITFLIFLCMFQIFSGQN